MFQDLKLKFYQLMIEVARNEGSYLDICKYYRAMFDTPSVLEDKNKKHEVSTAYFLILLITFRVLSPDGAPQFSSYLQFQ